ncbi:MAG: GntR family transcriptional regulator [Chloroflexi bacterium]|nr:GntR family transcriptional regulator [Chloroflexota bacterium]
MASRNEGLRNPHPRTLRQEVAEILGEAILSGQLEPGQHLVEMNLAREIGVGRVPVREALTQLEQQGLVKLIPNKGAQVIQPTLVESYEATVLRIQFEIMGVRLATARQDGQGLNALADVVQRMKDLPVDENSGTDELFQRIISLDQEFHWQLMKSSNSPIFTRVWSMIGPFIWLNVISGLQQLNMFWPPFGSPKQAVEKLVNEHQLVLDAIQSGDVNRAEASIRRHLTGTAWLANPIDSIMTAFHWPDDGRTPGP